ncbi:Pesticidal crystal protein cry22Aa [Photobacterium malacitanum]|uniref:Pesticidal crystal protein cry22Aa n=1 Tax=Photobacterium malacitanum TaxID=2204294 RepID=A0A1Y6MKL9_9GAMM|nr:GEVED domain-containing protein [Photobacterium malacitanum]SMY36350.1 Pesticidal crystal protein cry22Aa [Photobacterium malacitanum]
MSKLNNSLSQIKNIFINFSLCGALIFVHGLLLAANANANGSYDYGDAPDTNGSDYSTLLSNNGPRHELLSSLFLGDNPPDEDDGLLQNVTATADDIQSNNDEDSSHGIGLYASSTSLSFSQLVNNTTSNPAYLYAWIDWNNNGQFERNEFVEGGTEIGDAMLVANGDTSVNLLWSTLPSLSSNSNFFMRLRISDQLLPDSAASATDEDPRSLGLAGFGEVEDHQINVTPNFTQANTLTCSSSAQALTGADITTLSNYTALGGVSIVGDELHSMPASGSHPAKRFELEVLSPGKQFTYPVGIEAEFRLKNLNSGDGDLLFWLTDHTNMNGVFITDVDNSYTAWVGKDANWNGANSEISGFVNSTVNQFGSVAGSLSTTVFKRYRLSMYVQSDQSTTIQLTVMNDDGSLIAQSPVHIGARTLDPSQGIWLAHTSHNNDPSSQRYIFGGMSMVISDASGCDYGDAPDAVTGTSEGDYETLSINGGPSHIIDDVIYLGNQAPDSDTDGFNNGVDTQFNASDDDIKGTTPNDEDGVITPIVVDSTDVSLTIICNDFSAGSGDLGATVHGWIDTNRNGEFEESEYASQGCNDNSSTQAGSAVLIWSGLNLASGESYIRLRITDDNLVDTASGDNRDDRAYGSAVYGEIEDHPVTIIVNADYGDAPDTGLGVGEHNYRTLLADSGPYHVASTDIFIGSNAADNEDEAQGVSVLTADGDDTTGTVDDENSIAGISMSANDTSLTTAVTVTNNTANDSYLYAWVDWDNSGSFDVDEFVEGGTGTDGQIIVASGDNSKTLIWTSLSNLTANDHYYVRLRLSDSALLLNGETGSSEDPRSLHGGGLGEVEDHLFVMGEADFSIASCNNHAELTQKWWIGTTGGATRTVIDFTALSANGDPTISEASLIGMSTGNGHTEGTVTMTDPTNGAVIIYGDDGGVFHGQTHQALSLPFAMGNSVDFPIAVTPKPGGGVNEFYVFGNNYSTISAGELDFSSATVTSLGTVETASLLESQLVVPHANRSDTWLLTVNTSWQLNAHQLTASGIIAPVTSAIVSGSASNGKGAMDYSPATGKLAIAHDSLPYRLIIADFDAASGQLYNVQQITTNINRIGSSPRFSPDGHKVFFENGTAGDNGPLFYYDIATDAVVAVAGIPDSVSSIKFGPDGRLYAFKNASIYIIDNISTTPSFVKTLTMPGNASIETLPEIYAYCDYAGGTIIFKDYGDAPDDSDSGTTGANDYTTLASTNGPYHLLPANGASVYLGSIAPDSDDGTLQSLQSDADDTTNVIPNIDDEDAINDIVNVSNQSTSFSHTLACNGNGAPVYAWIDFNRNGIFEVSNYEFTAGSCADFTPATDGQVQLNWSNLDSATFDVGFTVMRLRIVPDAQFSNTDLSLTSEDERSIAVANDGEIEDHIIMISRSGDYGDAPLSYEVTGQEAAIHTTGIYYLGDRVDEESTRWVLADEDDATTGGGSNNNGNGDDEDGVQFALYRGIVGNSSIAWNRSSVAIEVSQNGYASIWIDWDNDGQFTEANDLVIADWSVTTGSNVHAFTMPASVTSDRTVWARIRYCQNANECNTISGYAATGEVEDHQATIGPVQCLALGDQFKMPASSNSSVNTTTNEVIITADQTSQRGAFWTKNRFDMSAEFRLRFGVYLGTRDGNGADGVAFVMHNDPSGTETQGLLGGGLGAQGISNSIGVEFDTWTNGQYSDSNSNDHTTMMLPSSSNLGLIPGTSYHSLSNIEDGKYYEVIFDWEPITQTFDYYFDGQLYESLTADLVNSYFGGSNLIYYGMTGSTGAYTNTQKICIIEQDISFFANDLGDAPDDGTNNTFHTLLESNGPVHEIGAISGIFLGDIEPDMDPGTYQSIDADQDDINDNSALRLLSDEDAVDNLVFDSSKSTFTLNVPCNDFVAGNDLAATVHGWIDFNGNQQFERSEYAYRECTDVDESSTGAAILRWIDVTQVQEGTSYLRLRISNQSLPQDLGPTSWDEASTGTVVGGEVEDHKITFSQASDFGDAPDSYHTLSANNGAEHGLGSYRYSLYLGSTAADADSDGFSDGVEDNPNTATDDDNVDTSGISAGNDEDAVTGMPGFFIDSTDYQVDVVCNDHDGNVDLGATVYAWVDFNHNGSFDASNNEFAQAQCNDADATTNGSATLSFSGFTAAAAPATTFARLRITTQTLTATDSAGFAIDGEVEDYAVIVGFKVSGKVFADSNNAVTDGMSYYNGNLDAGELGISNVVVTLYDITTNTCQSTTTDTNGDYALAALTNHQYKLYETANETTPAPLVCPPEVGAVNSDGLLVNNTITDPDGYTSSSSNIIDLGTITSDDSGNNFADISAPGFASCDADGYLSLRTPADLFAVDLFTGDTEELAANITSTYKNGSLQVGYMMQYNHIIGDITQTNAKLIGLVDGNYNVHLLPITLTGSNINIAFNNATISDDGILYMASGNTGYILKVDVNPASETYLQEVGRPSISSFGTADFAINPLDGKLYGLRNNGTIAIFDPATNTRDNSKNVNKVISAGVTRNYNSNHFTSGYGAIYFDQAGNMYAVNNGKYTQGDISAPVLQIPIGNGAAANYTATIVSNLGFTMSSNDGARCRYAPLGLDFGDAPDSYQTLNSSSGPYHVTRNNNLWIGDNKPDNDVDGAPQIDAYGDDSVGTTPDDEDGFDNQVRVFVNNGSGSLTVPITNNSGKAATLYAWVDFNQLNGFELSERASIAVSATTTQANVTLNWNGLAGVVTGDTYLRLRLCTDDATAQCDVISGPASNGEVEDHLAKVIEGVFPSTTCDGIYQSSGSSATSFDFSGLNITNEPYSLSNIISNQTGFDNLNGIAFDRVGGVFYGSFIDNSNTLHIAMFDKSGNIVDVGAPLASNSFDIVNVSTGAMTAVLAGSPITASPSLVGQLGTINHSGEYLYLGHINSAQILIVNLNTFTVDAVNLLLPDIGMTTGGGFSLPFDSDWVFSAETGNIYATELAARTLYIINPTSGAIATTAIDFNTTVPAATSYGMVMGEDSFVYLMIDGNYDSDLNGSLDGVGSALYQLNILSKKALHLGPISGSNVAYSDAAGCIETAKDYGDADISYGAVSHQFSDNNSNGINDYSLGSLWDSEFYAHSSTNARDDNLYTLADEDGVIIPAQLQAGTNTITLSATQPGVVNIWLDYQHGGSFDSSEQLLTNYAVTAGDNSIVLTLDATAMGSYNGATILRVRYCAAMGQCDQYNDVVQGSSASNGEVEDYQVWTTAVSLVTNSCNNFTLSSGANGNYGLESLQPDTTPLLTTSLQQPVTITSLTNFDHFNGLGMHPESYLIYGVVTDSNSMNGDAHLVVTDQSGSEVVNLGRIVSAVNQTLQLIPSSSIVFNKNQPLANVVNGVNIQSATRGAIDPTGNYLYLHHQQWQSLIKVHLKDQTFTIVSLQSALTPMGGDMAFDKDGNLYNADLLNGQLYQLNPTLGTINSVTLNWHGASAPIAGGAIGALIMDDSIFAYAVTKNGSHDIDRNGIAEHTGSAMYRINTVTGDIVAIAAMDSTYNETLDGAGCFVSADYGDSTADIDGNVTHRFYDDDNDGEVDYRLGVLFDPELTQFNSADARGDDIHDIDDEDGVNMPASIVVNSIVNVDVTVTNQGSGSLKLNVWVDMNGNGSYRDTGEQIVNELDVINGINSVQLLLPAAYTQGYNGNTTIRFRLCEQANQCNAPDDAQLGMLAPNGEVEDYPFELINQIVIKGFIFEDNAAGSATAHDGVKSGLETGLGQFTVQAFYQGGVIAGYNPGDILSTVRSRGDGSYEILLPVEVATQPVLIKVVGQARWIDISESDLSSIPQASSSSVTDNQVTVTANAGDNVEYLNFGKVKPPTLEADNFTEVEPNNSVLLRHQLHSFTSGSINLIIDDIVITPTNNNWSITLYRDQNCNGVIDIIDNAITAPITVIGNTDLCLLSKVFIPSDAGLNASARYAVKATMVFEDVSGTGHGISRIVTDTDTVKVTFVGAGELKLTKTVSNLTQGSGITTQNTAKPNDVLRYDIHFENVGTGVISDVTIYDDTPAYTVLEQPLDCNNYTYPTGLNCNIVTLNGNNVSGYKGQIKVELTGELQPSENGSIYYQVNIE